MKSLFSLLAAALAVTALDASETKAPPPSTKASPPNAAMPVPLRPDLKVTAPPNNVIGPLFDFRIENVGNMASKEAGIQFWVMPPCALPASQAMLGAGKLIKTGEVKALVVTTSPSLVFKYSFEMPPPFRGCAIKVVLDPEHHLLETTRDNNEVILQTQLPPAPDLVPYLSMGEYNVTQVRIKNEGNATAPASVVRMSCSSTGAGYPCDPVGKTSQKTWNWNVPSIPAGQTHTIISPVAYAYKDFLTIQADINHQVGEWNETNNVWPKH